MKLMIVAPMWLPIPAKTYGGTERIVHQLTNGLVEKGHQITLCGHGETFTKAQNLLATYPRPLRDDGVEWADINFDMIQGAKAVEYAEKHQLDAIIFHSSWPHQLPFSALSRVPSLYVLHGVWTFENYAQRHDKSEVDVLYAYRNQNFISLSHAQQNMVKGLNYAANIYNGIDLDEFTFKPSGSGYVAWIGRLEEQKGPHLAIQVAKKLGIKLKLAGPRRLEIPSEKKFWKKEIEPHLGDQVEWVGDLDTSAKNELLGNADVLINPYVYNEAFGLVTAEALACGTPVVVPSWGGGPEIIEDGVSGFTGSNVNEWVEATQKALKLNRRDCRKRAEKFSIDRMVVGYEKAVKKLIQSQAEASSHPAVASRLNSYYPSPIPKSQLKKSAQSPASNGQKGAGNKS